MSGREYVKQLHNRVDANDADACFGLGTIYLYGDEEIKVPQDREKGLRLLHRGGELGSARSYCQLACA